MSQLVPALIIGGIIGAGISAVVIFLVLILPHLSSKGNKE